MLACIYCLGKGKTCSLEPSLVEESGKADMDRDPEEAGMAKAMVLMSAAVVVQTAEALEAMEGVQATEEAKGSIVKLSLVPEERAEEDHAEGVLRQCEQFEWELRVMSTDYTSPVAEEAVARALGEDLDMQEVSGVSAMVTVAELVAMEGVQRTAEETVPRQG